LETALLQLTVIDAPPVQVLAVSPRAHPIQINPVTLSVTNGSAVGVRVNRSVAVWVVSHPYWASWPQKAVVSQPDVPGVPGHDASAAEAS
jgi:hypothetical protein